MAIPLRFITTSELDRSPDGKIGCSSQCFHAGFVFDDSVEGLACHRGTGEHILYINPLMIEEFVQDKHQMAYKLWDLVIHEFSHIWSYLEDGNQYHNESFVLKTHQVRDFLWDQREIQTIFNECWKAVK
jgi:hypothetical protein